MTSFKEFNDVFRDKFTFVIRRMIFATALSFCLVFIQGCSIPDFSSQALPDFDIDIPLIGEFGNGLSEVSPPELILSLKSSLSASTPKVDILEPANAETLKSQDVDVRLKVSGLKTFKDSDLGLGPHIAVSLDDQAPIEVFDPSQPIRFRALRPGTHVLRAIAAYPWHESFKNKDAYSQITFDVLTSSHSNAVSDGALLTTSSIEPLYTAEPILIDFVVRSPLEKGAASKVKATLNGQSFVIDDSNGTIYLSGLDVGQNWLKLELEDMGGRLSSAPYSEQLYAFEFQPEKTSPLGQLLSEELSLAKAGGVVGLAKPISKPTESALSPNQKGLPEAKLKGEKALIKTESNGKDGNSLAIPKSDRITPKSIKPNPSQDKRLTSTQTPTQVKPSNPKNTSPQSLPSSPKPKTPVPSASLSAQDESSSTRPKTPDPDSPKSSASPKATNVPFLSPPQKQSLGQPSRLETSSNSLQPKIQSDLKRPEALSPKSTAPKNIAQPTPKLENDKPATFGEKNSVEKNSVEKKLPETPSGLSQSLDNLSKTPTQEQLSRPTRSLKHDSRKTIEQSFKPFLERFEKLKSQSLPDKNTSTQEVQPASPQTTTDINNGVTAIKEAIK